MLQQKSLHMHPGGGGAFPGLGGLGGGGRPGDLGISPTSTDLIHRPGNPLGPVVGLTLAAHHHNNNHHHNNHNSFKSSSNNKNSSLHRFSVEALAGTGNSHSHSGIKSEANSKSLADHSDNESINSWDEDIPIDSDSDDDLPLSPMLKSHHHHGGGGHHHGVPGGDSTESESSRGAVSPKNLRTRDK